MGDPWMIERTCRDSIAGSQIAITFTNASMQRARFVVDLAGCRSGTDHNLHALPPRLLLMAIKPIVRVVLEWNGEKNMMRDFFSALFSRPQLLFPAIVVIG